MNKQRLEAWTAEYEHRAAQAAQDAASAKRPADRQWNNQLAADYTWRATQARRAVAAIKRREEATW